MYRPIKKTTFRSRKRGKKIGSEVYVLTIVCGGGSDQHYTFFSNETDRKEVARRLRELADKVEYFADVTYDKEQEDGVKWSLKLK